MSINKKLNEDFFETKQKHKQNRSKKKLTTKKVIINLIITFILITISNLLNVKCQNRIENNKKSDFNLEKDYAEFKIKMPENDTITIFVNAGVCTSQLYEKISIIKKGKEITITPEFKDGNVRNSKFEKQKIVIISETDTLWNFGDFLKRNANRTIRKNEMSNPRLRLKYKDQRIDYYTNGLSDANNFLLDYTETMKKINIDIIKFITKDIDTIEWNKLEKLNENEIQETKMEIQTGKDTNGKSRLNKI